MRTIFTLIAVTATFACFSALPSHVTLSEPSMLREVRLEEASGTVSLPAPTVTSFIAASGDMWGDLYFNFPSTDSSGNSLDTGKLYYNILIDGEPLELYSDEYAEELSGKEGPMTDIPWSMSGTNIWNAGAMHYFHFLICDYDTFAIRTKYVDGDNVSYSAAVYAYDGRNGFLSGPAGLEVVTSAPDGARWKGCFKEGGYFYYSGGSDVEFADMDYDICRYFISGDKFYLQKSLTKVPAKGFLVGTIDSEGIVTFDFPQYLHHLEAEDETGMPTVVDIYALACEFVSSEDNPEAGSFYPCEKSQKIRYRLDETGSLQCLDEDIMIGSCKWVTTRVNPDTGKEELIDEPFWSWDGNGDILTGLRPITEEPQTVPDDLETEETWVLVDGVYGAPAKVGIKGDMLYLSGLYPESYCVTGPMIGRIDGNKVRFPNTQYIAADYDHGILIYFKAGRAEGQDIVGFEELVFDYDKDAGTLRAGDIVVFTSSPTKIIHYVEHPEVIRPDLGRVGKELYNPRVESIRLAIGTSFAGALEFIFPNVDKAGNLLDTSRLSYSIFVDGELFELYPDEYKYDMPEDTTCLTEIPYDWNGNYLYRLGKSHYFSFFFQDFDTLAIQTQYRGENGETTYSDKIYVPGFGADSVKSIRSSEDSVEYYSIDGVRLAKAPAAGLYVTVTRHSDGRITTTKNIAR